MQVAKLSMRGRSQAVRLPEAFRFQGKAVSIRRDPQTGEVILSPIRPSWDDFFGLRDALIRRAPTEFDGFMDDRDQGLLIERDKL